jgi:outer membrane protein OmpA-like peptidoglycan-associated protein
MLHEKLMANGRVTVPGIYFDVGTAELRPESSSALSVISALLRDHSELHITIEAHTDNVGAPERNQQLSDARAAAVAAFLHHDGIARERVRAIGLGSTQPLVPNDSPANRQRNRRVEIVLQKELLAQ